MTSKVSLMNFDVVFLIDVAAAVFFVSWLLMISYHIDIIIHLFAHLKQSWQKEKHMLWKLRWMKIWSECGLGRLSNQVATGWSWGRMFHYDMIVKWSVKNYIYVYLTYCRWCYCIDMTSLVARSPKTYLSRISYFLLYMMMWTTELVFSTTRCCPLARICMPWIPTPSQPRPAWYFCLVKNMISEMHEILDIDILYYIYI